MKMEPIKCSVTSAFNTQTPGRYPKGNALHSKIIILQSEIQLTAHNSICYTHFTSKNFKKSFYMQ